MKIGDRVKILDHETVITAFKGGKGRIVAHNGDGIVMVMVDHPSIDEVYRSPVCFLEKVLVQEYDFKLEDHVQVRSNSTMEKYRGRIGRIKEIMNDKKQIGVFFIEGAGWGRVVYFTDVELDLMHSALDTKEEDIRNQHHYARFKIQPVVFIMENNLTYEQGAIIKYILRFDAKNGLEDLEKARHYLDMMIQKKKGQAVTP